MSISLGPYTLTSRLALAPMAGITDRAFRRFCRAEGVEWAPTEMISANTAVYASQKTLNRLDHADESGLRIVQIAGSEPEEMAQAARHNVELGAQVIDINMGCPAKKVCKKLAGSALLSDEKKVGQILEAVVAAVSVPVSLKFRTGPTPEQRNARRIARIAQDAGIALLALHGRTRADKFAFEAEFDTVAEVVNCTDLPVLANGDITTPEKAAEVLEYTQAAGVMIGRAAQGNPWIFHQIQHYLDHGQHAALPTLAARKQTVLAHLSELYQLYGEYLGVRVARKHIGWYCHSLPEASAFRAEANRLESSAAQCAAVSRFFDRAESVAAAEGH